MDTEKEIDRELDSKIDNYINKEKDKRLKDERRD